MESKPLLQVALDCADIHQMFRIAELVQEYSDILEIGTLLLKKEGISVIEKMKQSFPEKLVFVDTKTVDFGKLEARMMFEAGADMISICGVASDRTIEFAVQEAHARRKHVMVDLLGAADTYRQVKRLSYLQPDYLTVHTGVDDRDTHNDLFDKVETIAHVSPIPIAVAGGIQLDDIPYLLVFNPAIIIVGASIITSPDPRRTAQMFWKTIHESSLFANGYLDNEPF